LNKHIAVIGSGFGGIASALRMKKLGFEVTLIERLGSLGGRARVFERNGYKHDAGPTVITAPFLFKELFELFDEKIDNYLEFKSLDPWYRFYFHNGQEFDYRPSIEDTIQEIEKYSKEDAEGYRKLLKHSERIFNIGFLELSDKSFSSFWEMIKQIPSLLKLQSYLTVSGLVNKYLKNPFMRKAFSIHPLLVGGDPHTTTSIYALIHYLERKWGVYFCMGGTGKIILELEKLSIAHGITILKNTDVSEIILDKNVVTGLKLNDQKVLSFDGVICNADPPTVYSEMIKGKTLRRTFKPEPLIQYSMGLFVLFFGTKKQYPSVAHHTIWMSERFKELLKDIFQKKTLSEDFSLYLHRPTATDPSFAPDGCDSFYVLCPVPNLLGNINWELEGPKLKDKIISELSKTIMPNLEEVIEEVFWMDPNDFKKDYRSMHGAGFSIAPIFSQSAWFRYHNKDPQIKNLYFAAAGSHPGAGIPGVLCSAKIVEKVIKQDFKLN
jgi:phytoene desaturase|tara:strand:- start:203 stop:1684 length:1482 start_codon:yes stop_codon:yes gene_type:complete